LVASNISNSARGETGVKSRTTLKGSDLNRDSLIALPFPARKSV